MKQEKQVKNRSYHRPVEILFEDRDILVVDKAPGILTIDNDRDHEKTAYRILTDYVRKGYSKSRNRIFIVHRIDRETSGILVFAKNENAKRFLQDHWDTTEKKYLAIAHGHPVKKSDIITTYLAENSAFFVYSTPNHAIGKLAKTEYKVVTESQKFSLLEINLLTGRKNQIRVHLSEIGHPVAGDDKYGDKNDGCKRLALHAKSISLMHPYSGKMLYFETETPEYFDRLMRK